MYKVGVVGATGVVGKEIIALLENRGFPISELRCFASAKSKGTNVKFCDRSLRAQEISNSALLGLDFVFFAAGRSVSKEFVPVAVQAGAVVIDSSSQFRMDEHVPLIIPEINFHKLKSHRGIIASPNCTATMLLLAIAPLYRYVPIKRIVLATYQAASGAGARAMQDLEEETRAVLEGKSYKRQIIPFPYAFNLFLHNSPIGEDLYNEEENKILLESRKILDVPNLLINASCVRVPTLRAHALAINVEFEGPIDPETAKRILQESPGIKIFEDLKQQRFPMPVDASGINDVLCGRIRRDVTRENTLDLWVVGDQLLKGAALNAVQIAEHLK